MYKNYLFGNNYVSPAIDKILPIGNKVSRLQMWRCFHSFFCCYDFRVNVKVEGANIPLGKVQYLLDELNTQMQRM